MGDASRPRPAGGAARVGRFEVHGVLGEGAMGRVLDALDPVLGRRVAIKLLHPDTRDTPDAATRLLREAQALARLSDPNVVAIYEAGLDGDEVFVAMERVAGTDARTWLAAAPRSLAAICEVYRQAALGLAAAHRSGLVHRDVKPDNILVGDDGRVRVTDFGLVAAAGVPAGEGGLDDGAAPTVPAIALHHDDPLTAPLTRTGAILGTPPYMAPEAHTGGTIDAASDQWSLCVAWWEALAGARPFVGATYRALFAAIVDGAITRGEDAIPPAIRAVLARGLTTERTARWPSLDALIAAMDGALDEATTPPPPPAAPSPPAAGPRPPRRRRVAIAAGALVTGAIAAGAWWPRGTATSGAAEIARASVASSASSAAASAAGAAEPPPVPRRLTSPGGCPYMPAFADDATVVFDDGRGELWAIAATGGAPRQLTSLPGDQWRASRGRRLGEILHGDPAGIVARDVATGATETFPIHSFAFAAGGDALFYAPPDIAEIRRREGGEDRPLVRLPDGLWQYAISASVDGRRIAITTHAQRSTPTVCVGELDDTGALAGPLDCLRRDDVITGRAALTPDGATLYYQTRAGIRRRRLATGADELWLPGAFAYGGMEVARDGRTLVYGDTSPRETRVAPVDAIDRPVVHEPGSWADAAPDGRWVHVRWTPTGAHELVEQSATGERRVLVTDLGRLEHATYDPAGRRIAFEVDGDQGGIWIVDAGGHPPRRLTSRDGDSNPVWTGDGRIAFTRWDELKRPFVHIVDPAAGLDAPAGRTPANPQPRMTLAAGPLASELLITGDDHEQLWAWDPGSGRERALLVGQPFHQPVVSRDRRRLAFFTDDGVWEASLEPGAPAPRRVWALPPCALAERPAWDARDRLHVAYRPWAGDVYAVVLAGR